MSPDLLPAPADEPLTMRLRFYDVCFAPLGADSPEGGGRFREAVVAVSGSVGDFEGEVSLFMWTDSNTYMTWGREVFGWPLRRGEFSLVGPLWEADDLSPGRSGEAEIAGTCEATLADGTVAVAVKTIRAASGGVRPAIWITPRRILRAAGCMTDEREVLVVRPEILAAGTKYEASGEATLSFRSGHPLAGVPVPATSLDVVDGFRIVVGTKVEAIGEREIDGARSSG
jgi:hypothetical protein